MQFEELVKVFAGFGWQGLGIVAAILVLVFAARKSGIVATGDHARVANIVLSAILYGLGEDPSAETALLSVIASILAGLSYELIKWAAAKISPPAGAPPPV